MNIYQMTNDLLTIDLKLKTTNLKSICTSPLPGVILKQKKAPMPLISYPG